MHQLGQRIGQFLASGDMLCLLGDLGAGKTTLCQGIGAGWGLSQALTSPTFVVVKRYQRADGLYLHHIDAYRLETEGDLDSIAFDDILDMDGVVLIEWADNIRNAISSDAIWITLDRDDINEYNRHVAFSGNGVRFETLMARIIEERS